MSYMRSLVIIVYVCIHYIFMWSLLAMANSGILCVSMYVHCVSQDSKEGWAYLLLFPALSTESLFCSGVACATCNVVLFFLSIPFEISEGASVGISLFHSTGIAQTCKVKYKLDLIQLEPWLDSHQFRITLEHRMVTFRRSRRYSHIPGSPSCNAVDEVKQGVVFSVVDATFGVIKKLSQ